MAKWFRLWEKKRGSRQTGSPLVGSLGEALFFGMLFLLGTCSLVYTIVDTFADPDPQQLQLGFGYWLVLLVSASFTIIGGGGSILALLRMGTSAERRSAFAKRAASLELLNDALPGKRDFPFVPSDANFNNSPGTTLRYRLPCSESPAWRLSIAGTFCLVWNALAVLLWLVVVQSHRGERPEWLLTAFIIPFTAIGCWAIYYFARQLVLHTGIGPSQVEISDHPLRPGASFRFHVSQSGRLTLSSFSVALVCEEIATFRQGTDLRTERCEVYRDELYRRAEFNIDPGIPFEHEGRLAVPPGAMHSFQANFNAVHWKLEVVGELVSWPRFVRSFPLLVYPAAAGVARTLPPGGRLESTAGPPPAEAGRQRTGGDSRHDGDISPHDDTSPPTRVPAESKAGLPREEGRRWNR